jgi:hypothetical protein
MFFSPKNIYSMAKSSKGLNGVLSYLHNNVNAINNSKLFAGLMIIILNISSKFVTIKLSKSMESYLKHTFSRNLLIYAIAWMGTRDIYIAFIITTVFVICMDYLFNEESAFCCLSSQFKDYHISLMENQTVTPDEVNKAKKVIEMFENQTKQEGLTGQKSTSFVSSSPYTENNFIAKL